MFSVVVLQSWSVGVYLLAFHVVAKLARQERPFSYLVLSFLEEVAHLRHTQAQDYKLKQQMFS
jgi:hypothetical protein